MSQSAVERYAALPGVCVVHLRGVGLQQRDSVAGNRWLPKCLALCPQALVRILDQPYRGGLETSLCYGPRRGRSTFHSHTLLEVKNHLLLKLLCQLDINTQESHRVRIRRTITSEPYSLRLTQHEWVSLGGHFA